MAVHPVAVHPLFTQERRAAAERGADLRVAFLHRGARGAHCRRRGRLRRRGMTCGDRVFDAKNVEFFHGKIREVLIENP